MKTSIKTFAQRTAWRDSIDLQFIVEHSNGAVSIAREIHFEPREPDMVTEPCLSLKREDAQRLMDELWNCGLRPSEGSGSAGSLAATEHHLKDMQEITKGLLKKIGVTF